MDPAQQKRRALLLIGLCIILFIAAVAIFTAQQNTNQQDNNGISSTSSTSVAASVLGDTASLGIDVALLGFIDNGNGAFTVDYRYTINNPSSVAVQSVMATSRFSQAVPGGPQVQVVNFQSSAFSLNGGFNGLGNQNLLASPITLTAGQSGTIDLRVIVVYSYGSPNIVNYAFISGQQASSSSSSSSTSTSSGGGGTGSPTSSTSSSGGGGGGGSGQAENEDEVTFGIGITSNTSWTPNGEK